MKREGLGEVSVKEESQKWGFEMVLGLFSKKTEGFVELDKQFQLKDTFFLGGCFFSWHKGISLSAEKTWCLYQKKSVGQEWGWVHVICNKC